MMKVCFYLIPSFADSRKETAIPLEHLLQTVEEQAKEVPLKAQISSQSAAIVELKEQVTVVTFVCW